MDHCSHRGEPQSKNGEQLSKYATEMMSRFPLRSVIRGQIEIRCRFLVKTPQETVKLPELDSPPRLLSAKFTKQTGKGTMVYRLQTDTQGCLTGPGSTVRELRNKPARREMR